MFTVIPLVELAILIKIGQHIGLLPTLGIVILTGVSGALLAQSQGLAALRKIQDEVAAGIMPGEQILNGLMIFCGGLLLLTPGLLTDAIGFTALIPPTRSFIKKLIRKKLNYILITEKEI